MAIETQYKGNTGICKISTANSNTDGSGSMGELIISSQSGAIIKTIIIKALVSTTQGMIRFFVKKAESIILLFEVPVLAVTKSSRDVSFYRVIPMNYSLEAGDTILVSPQNAEEFNIIAEGLNWFYGETIRADSTQFDANTGAEIISTANSNLNGSGSIVTVFTAKSSGTHNGCEITSIVLKAQVSTTPGMIRLYLSDGGEIKYLFHEVIVPAITRNGINKSFSHEVITQGRFAISPGYLILASTQNAEAMSVVIGGLDWKYPA